MKPHSGKWIGTFAAKGDRIVEVQMRFDFNDDGSLTGNFVTHPMAQHLTHWDGPGRGSIKRGHYSLSGSIHFEEDENAGNFGQAVFEGQYMMFDRDLGTIWGTVLISKGSDEEKGILILGYATSPEQVLAGCVWCN